MYLRPEDASKKEKTYILREVPSLDIEFVFDNAALDELPLRLKREIESFAADKYKKYEDAKMITKVDYPGHDGGIQIDVHVYGLETDKEFNERVQMLERAEALAIEKETAKKAKRERKQAQEAERVAAERDQRRALYEKLRAEFGEDDTNPSTSLDSLGL